jgi:hypothetical protein
MFVKFMRLQIFLEVFRKGDVDNTIYNFWRFLHLY